MVKSIAFFLFIIAVGIDASAVNSVGTGVTDTARDAHSFPFVPGDAVRITVYPDTTGIPNGIYHISSDGAINLPLQGWVHIGTMSVHDLSEYISKRYVDYLKTPNATVRPLIRASAVGGFHSPGLMYVDPEHSLWDLVRMAGGPIRDDGMQKIHWQRGDSTLALTILPYLNNGESLRKIGFVSGDRLVTTDRPRRTPGEIVTTFILPVLSFAATMAFTGLTVYQLYK